MSVVLLKWTIQNERGPAEWTNRKELLQVALFVLGEKYV